MENFEEIRLPWSDWKIVKYLGGGAYGKVYEIERNISGIQEKAALKIISRPKDTSEIESYYDNGYDKASIIASYEDEIQNYLQEYKLMRELQGQSNIVSCDDFSFVRNENGIGGEIFIRMELLTSLQQVMRERPLSVEEIIELGKDISQALILCERKDIIHRDIKPANIMVSDLGNYKLGDFGVSKVMDHTTGGTKTGTEGYIAPEVVHMEKYGKTVDIYSLGIVLYWLLNNRKMPFLGADEKLTASKIEEAFIRRYKGEKLPAPKNGSTELKQIVLKACEYQPKDRYQTAQEMYDVLNGLSGGAMSENRVTEKKLPYVSDETTSVEDWQESDETVGKSMYDSSDGQTAGNSWGETGGTIGVYRNNIPKGSQNVYAEEKGSETIGIKNPKEKQKKKTEPEKNIKVQNEESVKGDKQDTKWYLSILGINYISIILAAVYWQKNDPSMQQSTYMLMMYYGGAICIHAAAIFVIKSKLLAGISGCIVSMGPVMIILAISDYFNVFSEENSAMTIIVIVLYIMVIAGCVWDIFGIVMSVGAVSYFKEKSNKRRY